MNEWHIRFGTAGTSDSFEVKGYKSSLDIPAYTAEMGLDAFEYQCGHGVRLGVDKAGKMAADAAERTPWPHWYSTASSPISAG